jgi:hypothetical protein
VSYSSIIEGLNITSGNATFEFNRRALGFSVRCIAEEVHYSLSSNWDSQEAGEGCSIRSSAYR